MTYPARDTSGGRGGAISGTLFAEILWYDCDLHVEFEVAIRW